MKKVIQEFNVYSIEELSEIARNRAYDNWHGDNDYISDIDNRETLSRFESIFPIKVNGWKYGYNHYIKFNMTCDDCIEDLEGIRLAKYIWNNYKQFLYTMKMYYKGGISKNTKFHYSKINYVTGNCPLTGYYLDEEIITPIHDFLNNLDKNLNTTFRELMAKCLYAWLKACHEDYQNYFSIEHFVDISKVNEWEYYENGRQYY
jgi:hypothetical protein